MTVARPPSRPRPNPVMMNASSGSWTRPTGPGARPARVGKTHRTDDAILAELQACFPEAETIWWGEQNQVWWALVNGEFIEARDLEDLGHQLWRQLRGHQPSRRRDHRLRLSQPPRGHLGQQQSYPPSPLQEPIGQEHGVLNESRFLMAYEPERSPRQAGGWWRRQMNRLGLAAA
jgi:hypothetical protein